MLPDVNPVSCTCMNTQLAYALPDWLDVPKVSSLHLTKAELNSRQSHFVAETIKPDREWRSATGIHIFQQLKHRL